MEINTELIAKARTAKSPEELLALAKENGIELTEETAKMYFDQLHPKTGELDDDELDNVADASRRPAGIDASISHKDSHLSVSRVPVHNAAIGASIRIASAVLFGVRF